MPFFIASFCADPSERLLENYADAADFLPLAAVSKHSHVSPDGRVALLVFTLGAEDRPPMFQERDAVVSIDGLPQLKNKDEVWKEFVQRADIGMPPQNTGGYSGVVIAKGRLVAHRGQSGEYAIYTRRVGRTQMVSNRLALLAGVGPEPGLDHTALAWLASNGYIYNTDTSFEGIRRLELGETIEVSERGAQVRKADIHRSIVAIQKQKPLDAIMAAADDLTTQLKHLPWNGPRKFMHTLSGGKDSRAIFALLDRAGLLNNISEYYTIGNLYSPEVISAEALTKMAGVSSKHTLRRPPYMSTTAALQGVHILRNLVSSEGQLSLYDSFGFNNQPAFFVNGQHNILRGSFFPKYPEAGFVKIDDIRRELETTQSIDPYSLLNEDVKTALRADFNKVIQGLLDRGVPRGKIPEAFMWLVRTANWIGLVTNCGSVHRTTFNPLLDVQLNHLALAMPSPLIRAETIHFILIALASKDYNSVGFASQRWKIAEINAALDAIGWKGPHPSKVQPFEYAASFPNGSNPYLSSDVKAKSRLLGRFVLKHQDLVRAKLPWLDVKRLGDSLRADVVPTAKALISQLGAVTGIFLLVWGRDAFRLSRAKAIIDELDSGVHDATPSKQVDLITQAEQYKNLLDLHEMSIAHFVKDLRDARQIVGDLSPEEEKPTDSYATTQKWRHIHVINKKPDELRYHFLLPGGRKIDRPNLAKGEAASTGFIILGKLQLEVVEANGRQRSCAIELVPDRLSYFLEVEAAHITGDVAS